MATKKKVQKKNQKFKFIVPYLRPRYEEGIYIVLLVTGIGALCYSIFNQLLNNCYEMSFFIYLAEIMFSSIILLLLFKHKVCIPLRKTADLVAVVIILFSSIFNTEYYITIVMVALIIYEYLTFFLCNRISEFRLLIYFGIVALVVLGPAMFISDNFNKVACSDGKNTVYVNYTYKGIKGFTYNKKEMEHEKKQELGFETRSLEDFNYTYSGNKSALDVKKYIVSEYSNDVFTCK